MAISLVLRLDFSNLCYGTPASPEESSRNASAAPLTRSSSESSEVSPTSTGSGFEIAERV